MDPSINKEALFLGTDKTSTSPKPPTNATPTKSPSQTTKTPFPSTKTAPQSQTSKTLSPRRLQSPRKIQSPSTSPKTVLPCEDQRQDRNSTAPEIEDVYGEVVTNFELPRFDWIQKMDYITLVFYTRGFANPFVEIKPKNEEGVVCVKMVYDGRVFKNDIVFHREVEWPCQVRVVLIFYNIVCRIEKYFHRIR